MSKALAINPDIGLREILQISQGNDFDVVYSPILQGPGNTIGGTFVKPAPTHEGATTTYDNPDALPGDVSVRQLKEFQDNFNSAEGTGQSGMCVLRKNSGETVLCSYRAGLYAEYAGNGTVVDGTEGVSMDAALDSYVQETGQTLQMPSVY